MTCAAAGLAAAEANEKVQANAIRALGHLLASSHSGRQSITPPDQTSLTTPGPAPASERSGQPICGGGSALVSLQQRASPADSSEAEATGDISLAREQLPAWVEPGLRCLIRALQSGSVKVQWNACYAVGALLRCQCAAAAAQRAGLLGAAAAAAAADPQAQQQLQGEHILGPAVILQFACSRSGSKANMVSLCIQYCHERWPQSFIMMPEVKLR